MLFKTQNSIQILPNKGGLMSTTLKSSKQVQQAKSKLNTQLNTTDTTSSLLEANHKVTLNTEGTLSLKTNNLLSKKSQNNTKITNRNITTLK